MTLLQAVPSFAWEVLGAAAEGAQRVGMGRLQGGWGYVWTSYAIAYGALSLYSLSLWLRRPKAPQKGNES